MIGRARIVRKLRSCSGCAMVDEDPVARQEPIDCIGQSPGHLRHEPRIRGRCRARHVDPAAPESTDRQTRAWARRRGADGVDRRGRAPPRVAIVVNGNPNRLDMEPRWQHEALRRGLRFVVSTDAHSTAELHNLRYGIDMARRGLLTARDVLKTRPVDEFRRTVRPTGA